MRTWGQVDVRERFSRHFSEALPVQNFDFLPQDANFDVSVWPRRAIFAGFSLFLASEGVKNGRFLLAKRRFFDLELFLAKLLFFQSRQSAAAT